MKQKPPLKHRLACILLQWTKKLSFKSAWTLSGVFTHLFFPLRSKLKSTIQDNINLVYPQHTTQEKYTLSKNAFRHTIAFGLEAGSVWMKPLQYGNDNIVHIQGLHILEKALDSNKGVLILLPHLGNWEIANQFIAPRAHIVALYKPHPNKQLEHYIYNARTRFGVTMVPTNRRGVSQILRHLKSGGVSVILPDQVPEANSGIFTPFFGHNAATQTLAPKLARSSGAHIIGLVCARNERGQFEVHITQAPQDIANTDIHIATTTMNTYIETLVNQFPEQYQWSYKRFKSIL